LVAGLFFCQVIVTLEILLILVGGIARFRC